MNDGEKGFSIKFRIVNYKYWPWLEFNPKWGIINFAIHRLLIHVEFYRR